ncbi:MAG: 3-hydroxyacyl-CoA dehydrogenase family protein [Bacteroidetes bacterium]|nr:3-hydroxyacyl-CoA dehydrogenase family protein [Bacteroidota bacterium]
MKQKTIQRNSTKMDSSKSELTVFVCGESPLVEEIACRCASHGYTVFIYLNESPQKTQTNFLHQRISEVTSFPSSCNVAIEVTNTNIEQKRTNIVKLSTSLPHTVPLLSSSVTITASEQTRWIQGKHRLVGIGAFPTLLSKPLIEVAPTIYTPKETLTAVSNFFHTLNGTIEIVEDRVGMVLPRLLCTYINHAFWTLDENIAAPDDIDQAITLGTDFPKGPIELSEKFTFQQIYAVLSALNRELSPQRYTIAPLIRQLALTGAWWHSQHKENLL